MSLWHYFTSLWPFSYNLAWNAGLPSIHPDQQLGSEELLSSWNFPHILFFSFSHGKHNGGGFDSHSALILPQNVSFYIFCLFINSKIIMRLFFFLFLRCHGVFLICNPVSVKFHRFFKCAFFHIRNYLFMQRKISTLPLCCACSIHHAHSSDDWSIWLYKVIS